MEPGYRQAIEDYIGVNASPPDKFSHQARLYSLAKEIAAAQAYDDDVVFAAAWLHDLGVFIGHRPVDPQELVTWDHIGYACGRVPGLLTDCGFPSQKIPAVLEVIRTHMPRSTPNSFEGLLVHDADILEQLGAVSILRTVSKVGRDTRFSLFSDAIRVLRQNARVLPSLLRLAPAMAIARDRVGVLESFLEACERESRGLTW